MNIKRAKASCKNMLEARPSLLRSCLVLSQLFSFHSFSLCGLEPVFPFFTLVLLALFTSDLTSPRYHPRGLNSPKRSNQPFFSSLHAKPVCCTIFRAQLFFDPLRIQTRHSLPCTYVPRACHVIPR